MIWYEHLKDKRWNQCTHLMKYLRDSLTKNFREQYNSKSYNRVAVMFYEYS